MIQYMFTSFLHWRECSLDVKSIENYCLNLKSKTPSVRNSNRGGWQSESLSNKEFLNPLIEQIELSIKEISDKFNFMEQLSIDNIWINVNDNSNHNIAHTHPNSYLSGVFYVRVPDNSGNLVFSHPNIFHAAFVPKKKLMNEYTADKWNFVPKENTLILFPSEISHYVEPNLSNEYRISIAFNVGESSND